MGGFFIGASGTGFVWSVRRRIHLIRDGHGGWVDLHIRCFTSATSRRPDVFLFILALAHFGPVCFCFAQARVGAADWSVKLSSIGWRIRVD